MPEPPKTPFLPDPYPITNIKTPFRITHTPPASKSLTNRALLLAALTPGTTTITNPLRADDSEVMLRALQKLLGNDRIKVTENENTADYHSISINNDSRNQPSTKDSITLNLNNAGTATRFLTAAAATNAFSQFKTITIDGNERMRQRPIAELVDNLRKLGAHIKYLKTPGCVPLQVTPTTLQGCTLQIDQTLSSQFISALLQIGPLCKGGGDGLTLKLNPQTIRSPTYISMTLSLMERFGAQIEVQGELETITIAQGNYQPCNHTVEPDASSATYFLAAAAINPGSVCTIENLGQNSLQGDAAFIDVLQQMGANVMFGPDFLTTIGTNANNPDNPQDLATPPLRALDINMNTMPDAALTLAVCALFAQGETIIRGIGNLRHKETDRLAALQNELTKCGATVEIEDNELLAIQPPPFEKLINNQTPIEIETYHDHRIAMAFALAGLRIPNLKIINPSCTNKTYPAFFSHWQKLTTTAS